MNTPEWNERIQKLAESVSYRQIIRGFENDRVAVMVEPRNNKVVFDLLRWMVHILARNGWRFLIFCGNDNFDSLTSFVTKLQISDIFEIRNINVSNITKEIYNDMCLSKVFWESIPYEHILIFQSDSVLLNGNIDSFLEYDYVGAIGHTKYIIVPSITRSGIRTLVPPNLIFQNGGLSLRKRSAMLKCLASDRSVKRTWEDTFFSVICSDIIKVAPTEVAGVFSVESVYNEKAIGYHAPWRFFTPEVMKLIYNNIEEHALKRIGL